MDALPMLSDTSDLLQDTHVEKVLATGCLPHNVTLAVKGMNEV